MTTKTQQSKACPDCDGRYIDTPSGRERHRSTARHFEMTNGQDWIDGRPMGTPREVKP